MAGASFKQSKNSRLAPIASIAYRREEARELPQLVVGKHRLAFVHIPNATHAPPALTVVSL
jgi:hypothetical protein